MPHLVFHFQARIRAAGLCNFLVSLFRLETKSRRGGAWWVVVEAIRIMLMRES